MGETRFGRMGESIPGALPFHLAQVLAWRRLFGKFLRRMRRHSMSEYNQCRCDEKTAQHTLQVYSAFHEQRSAMSAVVGHNLSLTAVVRAMADHGSHSSLRDFRC